MTLLTTAGYELESHELPRGMHLVKTIARLSQRSATAWPRLARTLVVKVEAVIDAFRVALLARRLAPDVVHLHCTHPIALLYLTLLRWLGLTVAATAHVVTPHEPLRFQQTIYGRIHRLPRLVIAHSRVDRGRLRDELAVPAERIVVIPHGEYGFFDAGGEPADRQAARRSRCGSGEAEQTGFGHDAGQLLVLCVAERETGRAAVRTQAPKYLLDRRAVYLQAAA